MSTNLLFDNVLLIATDSVGYDW